MTTKPGATNAIDEPLRKAFAAFDVARLRDTYEEQNCFLVVDDFVPEALAERLLGELEGLRSDIHRNYVPGQKKGGSIARSTLAKRAPLYDALYTSTALREFLEAITGERLLLCPDGDSHGCALYWYTEPGDHIGWHYDISFYRGRRFTVLLGLVENESSLLECDLHRDDPARPNELRAYTLRSRMLIVFDGDRLWHRVSPLEQGDGERVVMTMEFLTDATMSPLHRLVSNVKDAAAYFGFSEVFLGPRRRTT